jgi:hypothetical protein
MASAGAISGRAASWEAAFALREASLSSRTAKTLRAQALLGCEPFEALGDLVGDVAEVERPHGAFGLLPFC